MDDRANIDFDDLAIDPVDPRLVRSASRPFGPLAAGAWLRLADRPGFDPGYYCVAAVRDGAAELVRPAGRPGADGGVGRLSESGVGRLSESDVFWCPLAGPGA